MTRLQGRRRGVACDVSRTRYAFSIVPLGLASLIYLINNFNTCVLLTTLYKGGSGRKPASHKVILNVYDLIPSAASSWAYSFGLGIHHSGVEIMGNGTFCSLFD